jgi:histidyl-tRNA synthetase
MSDIAVGQGWGRTPERAILVCFVLVAAFTVAAAAGARYGLLLGEAELAAGEVTLKDLNARTQQRFCADAESLATVLRNGGLG